MSKLIHILFLIFLFFVSNGQQSNSTFSRNFKIFSEQEYHFIDSDLHTSVKPYFFSNADSIISGTEGSWLYRKWNSEHFIQQETKDYSLVINPILDVRIGREFNLGRNFWTNTRGIVADGKLGDRFAFYSSFLENQSVLTSYITNDIISRSTWVIPGQGESRWSSDTIFDYTMATGHFSYKLSRFSNIQFGTGKNFIGDGYRSMILSDNAYNYPYLKIQTSAGIFQYTNLYMEHIDMTSNPSSEYTYDRKYMTLHHLSANISDRLNIGIFESIVWKNTRTPEISGVDIAYLNPIIFLRPVEFSLNSSDNVLMGMNLKFKIRDNSHIYSQFVLDEFSLPEIRTGNKWWGNKYAYQLGAKYYEPFNIKNLIFQFENNFARPYTYSHNTVNQNYGHYYQSLAHPLGANFNEMLFFVDYKYKKWEIHLQLMQARYGGKEKNNPISFGNDIFMPSSDRPSDFGIEMYQGELTRLDYRRATLSYLLNPKTNLKIESSYVYRRLHNTYTDDLTNFIFFAIKSDIFNRYYDY